MEVQTIINLLRDMNIAFYTGVPDSQLRALCDCLMEGKGIGGEHVITANEGNAVALAVGEYLATGRIPVI